MVQRRLVSPATFQSIQNVDVDQLSRLEEDDLRPILPCLVRMSLCAPLDTSEKWTQKRKKILKCLSGLEIVNSLVGLLSIDFHALEQDARKEQQLRSKMGGNQTESVLISQLPQGVALEFERSEAARKLRLLLSELLFIMSQIKEPRGEFYQKTSELFESDVYAEEVSDVLCIAQAELPSLLPMTEVAEALLHVQNGAWLLCRLVSNVPDTFLEVTNSLVLNGERQDEDMVGGRKRAEALRFMCRMNPSQALTVRAKCVENCRLPSLIVSLTLDHNKIELSSKSQESMDSLQLDSISDLVAFVSGLLLGSDVEVRNWFAQFVRTGQKKKQDPTTSMLHALRQELLKQLATVLPEETNNISEQQVVQGSGFIRLYCALKGIAAMRFNEDEVKLLLKLVTCHPPPTIGGVRFISLGLCMLLACPYLIGNSEQEKIAIEWIRWLTREVSHFEKASGVKSSFGEMLLLIAIHFHSNQTHAIADLVCSTLGMKSAVKANALTRMKAIFTQEVFTEQVVTSHAVKVSVTQNLNANIQGFLPVHCTYQLLKSRAFSKHKVPIKEWIFKQICTCSTPLHPLLPPLIEVFTNSIIMPSAKTDRTNEPITEEDILQIFKYSIFTGHSGSEEEDMDVGEEISQKGICSTPFTSQLLMLYYILYYQDTLFNNMKSIVSSNRRVVTYSQNLLAQIPIKYLLQTAQKDQHLYAGLFSPLLRILATHYPHLCLVEDWLEEDLKWGVSANAALCVSDFRCTKENLRLAFSQLQSCPSQVLLLLEQLSAVPANKVLPFVDIIVEHLQSLLERDVPRRIQDCIKKVWMKLNTVMPRKLRVLTVNALRSRLRSDFEPYSEDDLTIDPLIVLRCDERVFRCPPILEINLRIMSAFLQASRSYLAEQIQAAPVLDKTQQASALQEREELKNALISAQESAAIQVLLECCLLSEKEKDDEGLLNNMREIQCLICSHLHQMFIADPNAAKLVHFQGYPSELLTITVPGIPSMHICLDFIPELLSQPHLDKQIFAIELVSYLSLQYALPKSIGIARLAINVMSTMLGVLQSDARPAFFLPTLPALVRVCRAFPPLCEDSISLLLQLGRVCTSHLSNVTSKVTTEFAVDEDDLKDLPSTSSLKPEQKGSNCTKTSDSVARYTELYKVIQKTFSEIVKSTALMKDSI